MGRKKIIVDNDSTNLIEFEGGGGGDEDGGWNWRREVRLVGGRGRGGAPNIRVEVISVA